MGSTQGAAILTPIDLVPGARADRNAGMPLSEVYNKYPAVLNIARILQTLDVDNDSSTGIKIPVDARTRSPGAPIDFSQTGLYDDASDNAVQYICEVKRARGAAACDENDVVDESAARSELTETENARDTGINKIPVVDAGADQSVIEGETVTLNGSASDSDGSISTVRWRETDRNGVAVANPVAVNNSDQTTASFTAPQVTQTQLIYFTLTATDNAGDKGADTVAIQTMDASGGVNMLPQAEAGDNQTVAHGASVTLDGSESTDADGTITSFAWSQVACEGGDVATPVTLTDPDAAQTNFQAPNEDAELCFDLTVTDNEGGDDTDRTKVSVLTNPEGTPQAEAGDPQQVREGDSVQLDGSGSTDLDTGGNPSSGELTHAWAQQTGKTVELVGADTATPTFEAPETEESIELVFTLTVTDADQKSASDDVTVTVNPIPPVTEACRPDTFEPELCGPAFCADVVAEIPAVGDQCAAFAEELSSMADTLTTLAGCVVEEDPQGACGAALQGLVVGACEATVGDTEGKAVCDQLSGGGSGLPIDPDDLTELIPGENPFSDFADFAACVGGCDPEGEPLACLNACAVDLQDALEGVISSAP